MAFCKKHKKHLIIYCQECMNKHLEECEELKSLAARKLMMARLKIIQLQDKLGELGVEQLPPEFKACPFCGSKEIAMYNKPSQSNDSALWYLGCSECGSSGPVRYSFDAAIKAWEFPKVGGE